MGGVTSSEAGPLYDGINHQQTTTMVLVVTGDFKSPKGSATSISLLSGTLDHSLQSSLHPFSKSDNDAVFLEPNINYVCNRKLRLGQPGHYQHVCGCGDWWRCVPTIKTKSQSETMAGPKHQWGIEETHGGEGEGLALTLTLTLTLTHGDEGVERLALTLTLTLHRVNFLVLVPQQLNSSHNRR